MSEERNTRATDDPVLDPIVTIQIPELRSNCVRLEALVMRHIKDQGNAPFSGLALPANRLYLRAPRPDRLRVVCHTVPCSTLALC